MVNSIAKILYILSYLYILYYVDYITLIILIYFLATNRVYPCPFITLFEVSSSFQLLKLKCWTPNWNADLCVISVLLNEFSVFMIFYIHVWDFYVLLLNWTLYYSEITPFISRNVPCSKITFSWYSYSHYSLCFIGGSRYLVFLSFYLQPTCGS